MVSQEAHTSWCIAIWLCVPIKQSLDLSSCNMHAQTGSLVSHLNSQTHLKLSSGKLNCQIIIERCKYSENRRVLDMDSLNTRRRQQTKKRFDQIVHNSKHWFFNVISLSLVAFGVLTDYRVYTQRQTDLKAGLFAFVYRIFRLNECVIVQSSFRAAIHG